MRKILRGQRPTIASEPGLLCRAGLSQLIAAGLLLAVAIATLAISAIGLFAGDVKPAGAAAFNAEAIDISKSPQSALVTSGNMVPGDRVTSPITIANNGSVGTRYAVRSTSAEDVLAAHLDMTIKTGVTSCTNAGFDSDGNMVYGPGDIGSTSGLNVIGNPAAGQDAGDRTLAAQSSEVLCVQVSLPLSTDSSVQGLTTSAVLDFVSEQTAINP